MRAHAPGGIAEKFDESPACQMRRRAIFARNRLQLPGIVNRKRILGRAVGESGDDAVFDIVQIESPQRRVIVGVQNAVVVVVSFAVNRAVDDRRPIDGVQKHAKPVAVERARDAGIDRFVKHAAKRNQQQNRLRSIGLDDKTTLVGCAGCARQPSVARRTNDDDLVVVAGRRPARRRRQTRKRGRARRFRSVRRR